MAEQVGGRAKVVVSILAATPTAELERAYPGVPVYRFIPNIPAEVRQGVLCYVPGTRAADGPEQEVLELFGRARRDHPARQRAADRAGDGADELRAGLHGPRGGVVRRRRRGTTGWTPDEACA